MAGKSTQDNCFQLVFLIDSNPAFWGPNYSAVDASNAIVLWVMRVLNYFNDYDKRKRSNLRWGYHFFTSRSLSHHVERRDFSEFSMGVFEEFEKYASKKFSDSFPQSHATSDLEETVAFTKPPAGAKSISCAFTNAMHDFQWDGPDTNSPVRRTQHNVINRKTRNVLFLLSGCPCDDASIRDFRGEGLGALTSLESLRNILMPSVLYNEFKEHDICLQWVNIGDIPSEKNSSVRPFLEGFLREFKGGIIPLISNGFSSACQSVSTLEEICCSFHGPFLPFKTVMDFYLAGKIPCLSEVIHGVEDHPKRNPCMPGIQGLLCSSGGVMKVHCSVWLSSMFQSAVRMYRPRNNDQASSVADNEQKKTGLQGACPMLLWIRGVIRNNHICPSWMHPLNAYSCIALDCRQMSTGSSLCSEEFISGWFQELLLSLAKECKSLVIDMIDGENGFPVCGILQPLTSVCSVISIISSNFLLKFEKCLFGNGEIASLDCSSIKSVKSCCDLITELGCKGVSKAALQPTSAGVFACLTGSQKYPQETAGEKEFKPGIVESWCLSPVVDEEERLLWSELKRRECKPQVHCVDGLATPMKDLKILYYRKNEKTKLEVVKQPLTCKSNSQGILKKLQGQKDVIKTSANEVSNTLQSSINKDDRSTIDPLVQMNESSKCLVEEHNQTSCTTDEETKNLTCHAEDESHLISAICSIYDKVLFEGGSVPTEITNIMMSVSNFYQKDGNERKKDFISQFLIENVLLNLVKLRAKYEGSGTGCTKEHQVKEYQLQVLLRIEIAALAKCDDQSNLVQEVTDLLRALSFMKDPDFLATFLSEEILSRYCHSLPKFLCSVYEGLMICPPREVLTPSKWSCVDDSPLRRSVRAISNQPRSSECRVVTRHSSVTDISTKRREIVVPAKAKQKENDKKKKAKLQRSISAIAVTKNVVDVTRKKAPVKLVRRNLFTDTDETEENNPTVKLPRKRKALEQESKTQTGRNFGRRNTIGILPKTAVQETPARKQVSHALWCKQDRARKRSRVDTEVFVLEESPLKENQDGDSFLCRSPRKTSGVILQRSHSFYGRSTNRGPLTRAKSFTDVGIGAPSKPELTEGSEPESKIRPPQGQSLSSVSPLRFSPRHKRKFSLHGLLNTTKECEEMTQVDQKVSTTTSSSIRSSPRILQKRSFSFIGFSSVPCPALQQKEPTPLSQENGSKFTPNRESPENSMKTPNKTGTELNECVVLLKPIHIPLKSPVHVSSSDVQNTQPLGIESPHRLKFEPCATNENLETISDDASPCARRSENARVTESLNQISSNSPRRASVDPKIPLTNHHFSECVVLLTPIKGPLTSPMDLKSQDVNSRPTVDDANVMPKVKGASVTSTNYMSLRMSPRFSPSSSHQIKDKKKSRAFCGSPAETKRLSPLNRILRQQKRKRCLSSSPVDKYYKEGISLQTTDCSGEERTNKKPIQSKDLQTLSRPGSSDGDNSGSSEDVEGWLTEMQKEFDQSIAEENLVVTSPPEKKRRIHKSVVFGRKALRQDTKFTKGGCCSFYTDASFEEDDEVFLSPSSSRRCHRKKTPLSASSIKLLQESPILYNNSKTFVPPSSHGRKRSANHTTAASFTKECSP